MFRFAPCLKPLALLHVLACSTAPQHRYCRRQVLVFEVLGYKDAQ